MTHDTALVPTDAPYRGATEAFDRFEAPSPGTYWRLRKACKRSHNERLQAPAMRKGTVLMLATIEHADGAPHAYTFAAHPGMPEGCNTVVHADDLYTLFERAPDGEAVRAAELLALLNEMEETKVQMLAPPPDAIPAALLTHDPSAAVGEPGKALATPELLQAISLRAERLKEDAEQRSQWIQKHSQRLGEQGEMLANFHQERAEAALARARSQLDGVAGLLKTVANLRLYTGSGVEVQLLRDGVPAAPDEPVTLYQDVLAFDEETLILLVQGGADHCSTEEIAEALADTALVDRMIPAPRGVTLVRFRSTHKEFIATADGASDHARAANARYNAAMSRESMRKRLLVRDGERLWLVDANDVLENITQLLPSAGEQAAYFEQDRWDRSKPPRRITRDDISYARAQREQLGALDHYAQVLVVLWGLADRTNLFENALIPKFANWLDPAFQDRFLRLLSLDTLIGVERPTFRDWQAHHNGFLAAGAWVAVDLQKAFGQERAPGAFSAGRYSSGRTYYDELYVPAIPEGRHGVLIERVQADAEGLYVELPTRYDGYNNRVQRDTRTVKLYVRSKVRGYSQPSIADGVLVLDRVHGADLSYYLQSRKERRQYVKYVSLFQHARAYAQQRDQKEAALRGQLREAVAAARLSHDPDRLEAALTDAIAVVRSSRRDRETPTPGSSAFRAHLKAALAALHAGLTDHRGRVAAIDDWAKHSGREPLRLVLTGKEAWVLYLVPAADEHDTRLGPVVHATRATVTFQAQGAASVTIDGRALLRARSDEQVVHDWEWDGPATIDRATRFPGDPLPRPVPAGATAWLAREPLFRASYADALATLDAAVQQSAGLDAGLDLPTLVSQARQYIRDASKKFVRRMPLYVAIGSATYRGHPFVLMATVDALAYAFHAGGADIKDKCREAIQRYYGRPELAMQRLENDAPEWTVHLAGIDEVTAIRKGAYLTKHVGRRASREECVRPDAQKKAQAGEVAIQALTPAGARLFPWLAALTARAIG